MVSLLTFIKQSPCVEWWNRFCVEKREAEESNHTAWRTQNGTGTEQISQTLNKYKGNDVAKVQGKYVWVAWVFHAGPKSKMSLTYHLTCWGIVHFTPLYCLALLIEWIIGQTSRVRQMQHVSASHHTIMQIWPLKFPSKCVNSEVSK